MNCIRILLVEDNAGDARLLREALRDHEHQGRRALVPCGEASGATMGFGFELQHVARLDEATRFLRDQARGGADVVLLDLSLPDGRGLDNVRHLRTEAPQVPIVVLTGSSDDALSWQAVGAGAQDYLVKGEVESRSLVRSLRYAIERSQQMQELARAHAAVSEAHAELEIKQAELLEANARLEALATTDGLTGLKNHRAFQERLTQEFARARRYKTPLSLLLSTLR